MNAAKLITLYVVSALAACLLITIPLMLLLHLESLSILLGAFTGFVTGPLLMQVGPIRDWVFDR